MDVEVTTTYSDVNFALFNFHANLFASKLVNARINPNEHDLDTRLISLFVNIICNCLINWISLYSHILMHLALQLQNVLLKLLDLLISFLELIKQC